MQKIHSTVRKKTQRQHAMANKWFAAGRFVLSVMTASVVVSCLVALPYGVMLTPLAAGVRYLYLFFSALRNPLQKTIAENKTGETESLYGRPLRVLMRGAEKIFSFLLHLYKDPMALMLLAATLVYVFVNPLSLLFFSQQASVLGLVNSCVEIALFSLLSSTRIFDVSRASALKAFSGQHGSTKESLQAILATGLLMVWLVHDEFSPVAPLFLQPMLAFFSTGFAQMFVSSVCAWNILQWLSENCFDRPSPSGMPVENSFEPKKAVAFLPANSPEGRANLAKDDHQLVKVIKPGCESARDAGSLNRSAEL